MLNVKNTTTKARRLVSFALSVSILTFAGTFAAKAQFRNFWVYCPKHQPPFCSGPMDMQAASNAVFSHNLADYGNGPHMLRITTVPCRR